MAVHVERQRRKCKILLPKFNTWKPVLLEQENGEATLWQHRRRVFSQFFLP